MNRRTEIVVTSVQVEQYGLKRCLSSRYENENDKMQDKNNIIAKGLPACTCNGMNLWMGFFI